MSAAERKKAELLLRRAELLAKLAIELCVGQRSDDQLGDAAREGMVALVMAVVEVAKLNAEPRYALDRAVAMLDGAPV